MMETPSKGSRAGRIVLWVLSALLAALYLAAGGSKLAGAQQHVEHFAKWGYPDWFRLLVGALEVAAGIALLIPRAAIVASATLAVVMAGAVYTHVRHDEAAQAMVPAVLLILLALVGYLRRRQTRSVPR